MISHCLQVTVLRLAVKYQLHPLPVEDTIQSLDHWLDAGCPQKIHGAQLCWFRLQQQSVPLVRSYGDNFFIILPMLRLTT